MEELGLDALTAVVLTGLVTGIVELIKRIFDKDWRAVATIVAAALVGGAGGLVFGLVDGVGAEVVGAEVAGAVPG